MKKVARMCQNVIIEPPFSTLHVCYTKAGVETATKKLGGGGGGGGETLPHLLATSPGLPLLFLKYIMQKSKKNVERNLNAWDRNLICHTHKLIVVVNINHTHTHSQYIPMVGACQKWGAVWGGDRPPCPPYVSTPVKCSRKFYNVENSHLAPPHDNC